MKNIMALIITLNLKDLLIKPTEDTTLQVFRSLAVGGFAFIVDMTVVFVLTSLMGVHYLISAAVAFAVAVVFNFFMTKKLVFTKTAKIGSIQLSGKGELLIFIAIASIGLGFTEVIMWLLTEFAGIFYLFSKFISVIIVFFWNFTARKLILYKV